MSQWLRAPNLDVPHGFSTRLGGSSTGVYESFNLGLGTGDDPAAVAENRAAALAAFGAAAEHVCALEQVHGAEAVVAEPGWYARRADAAVTDDPDLLLVISAADCLPILYLDPVGRAVGAAHAGWRGTAAGVAAAVVRRLAERYGSNPAELRVAFGPAIAGRCYQVGPEVASAFVAAGFPDGVAQADEGEAGRYRLDLVAANRFALERAGVRPEHIAALKRCTHCEPELFYSHRRDGLARGSHWALITLGGG